MEIIILTDDDLNRLEKRFGPDVRHMGPWTSDGVFGYCSVPVTAVAQAAEALEDPNLATPLSQFKSTHERTRTLIELLEKFGAVLLERIVAADRKLEAHSVPTPQERATNA